MMIRRVSSIVTLGALALLSTGCPDKKSDPRAQSAAERAKADKGEDKEPEEADEDEKVDADKKEEGGL